MRTVRLCFPKMSKCFFYKPKDDRNYSETTALCNITHTLLRADQTIQRMSYFKNRSFQNDCLSGGCVSESDWAKITALFLLHLLVWCAVICGDSWQKKSCFLQIDVCLQCGFTVAKSVEGWAHIQGVFKYTLSTLEANSFKRSRNIWILEARLDQTARGWGNSSWAYGYSLSTQFNLRFSCKLNGLDLLWLNYWNFFL